MTKSIQDSSHLLRDFVVQSGVLHTVGICSVRCPDEYLISRINSFITYKSQRGCA